jgi:hypothetical protein
MEVEFGAAEVSTGLPVVLERRRDRRRLWVCVLWVAWISTIPSSG